MQLYTAPATDTGAFVLVTYALESIAGVGYGHLQTSFRTIAPVIWIIFCPSFLGLASACLAISSARPAIDERIFWSIRMTFRASVDSERIMPFSFHTLHDVLSVSPTAQMVWIDAQWIIASMKSLLFLAKSDSFENQQRNA